MFKSLRKFTDLNAYLDLHNECFNKTIVTVFMLNNSLIKLFVTFLTNKKSLC